MMVRPHFLWIFVTACLVWAIVGATCQAQEDRMGRIAIEAGIRFESAMADWASWAVEEIAKSAS